MRANRADAADWQPWTMVTHARGTRRAAGGSSLALALVLVFNLVGPSQPLALAQTACTGAYTPIPQIQGSGTAAAITGTVTTQGVVVGDFEGSSGLQGFYLQDKTGDGDASTSDGIFVFTGSANLVSAGQVVRVSGYARERFNQTALNGSNSNSSPVPAANIVNCGTTDSVSPTDVTLPIPVSGYLERFEGMLVRFPQALVIAEYFNYDRFGELVLALPLDDETRPFTPTAIDEPGAPAQARALANSLRRITLDDRLGVQNPSPVRHPNGGSFALNNRFRGGDTVQNAVGVLGFDANTYRIQPTEPASYTAANPRPAAPDSVGGSLRVAAMNTLNFFLTLDYPSGNPADNTCGPAQNVECRGADSDQPDEFSRQRTKLVAALKELGADVLGLTELENTPGVDPLGDPTRGVVAGLNAALGAGTYAHLDTGVIGSDAIRVGLIYKPAVVKPVGDFKLLTTAIDPRFLDSKNRPSLAQTFDVVATGARFTVVVNHLKSKGSDCNDVGDPDAGDGQGNCNQTRKTAAQALVDWLATDPTGSGDRDFLIIGDLNSYTQEDPIDAIKAGPDDKAGTNDDYTNLIAQYQGRYAYSYVFDGQAGYLDYALASARLAPQVTGATEWHINADEPDLLDYDTSFKQPAEDAIYEPNAYRSSDHDPVLVGLTLNAPPRAALSGGECGATDASGTLSLTLSDPDGDAVSLTLASNSNNALVPNSNVVLGGSGNSRTITVSAAPQQSGSALLTFNLNDGKETTPFVVTVVVGTSADETLNGTAGTDLVFGLNGNDTLNGNDGDDLLCGGNGDDALHGGKGNDIVDGENGNDTITGGDGNDILRGGRGDDSLTGGMGTDAFSGGPGTDTGTDLSGGQGDTQDGTIP